MDTGDREKFNRLLSQARSDFDRIRSQNKPIRVQLLHKATNAEAEGVRGIPRAFAGAIAFHGAGNREARQVFDERGNATFRKDPIIDVNGNPIVNSAGEAFDFVMPASRTVTFEGDNEAYEALAGIAERAGRIVGNLGQLRTMEFARGWRFSSAADLWWATVFEIAWAGHHPLLSAARRLWVPNDRPSSFFPYDQEDVRLLASSGFGPKLPTHWVDRLPEAYVSTIENAVAASFDATETLLDELQAEPASKMAAEAVPPTTPVFRRRFAIALSFPGERRPLVRDIAHALRNALGESRIFYDEFHKTELSRPNMDLVLQRFYAQESDLVAVFVCGEYSEKEWCGLEWSAIRDLMKNHARSDEDVMFLRLDRKDLPGLLSIHGYLDIAAMSAREVADALIRRWSALR